MLSQWLQQYVWIILPVLAIPLAILLGSRRTNGAIIVSSAVAILAAAFMGYRTATNPPTFTSEGFSSLGSIVSQIGGVMLLAAWTLALAHAAQARRWRWFAIIVVAGLLSYAAQLVSELLAIMVCSFNPSDSTDFSACPSPNQTLLALITLGQAIGPIVALIYVFRTPGNRQHQLPEGLVVSSLRDKKMRDEETVPAD